MIQTHSAKDPGKPSNKLTCLSLKEARYHKYNSEKIQKENFSNNLKRFKELKINYYYIKRQAKKSPALKVVFTKNVSSMRRAVWVFVAI